MLSTSPVGLLVADFLTRHQHVLNIIFSSMVFDGVHSILLILSLSGQNIYTSTDRQQDVDAVNVVRAHYDQLC